MNAKTPNKKDVEITLAWLREEITLSDVGRHFQSFNSNSYHKVAMGLRQAYKDGKLIIK